MYSQFTIQYKLSKHFPIVMTIQGRIQDFPLGGAPTLVGGGANLQHRRFSVKTYVKTKEFGPVGGGGCVPETFVCRSATAICTTHGSWRLQGPNNTPLYLCMGLREVQIRTRKSCTSKKSPIPVAS